MELTWDASPSSPKATFSEYSLQLREGDDQ
jgi:hypothetical protein